MSYESAWIGTEVSTEFRLYSREHGGFACGDGAEFKCFGEEGKNARRPDASYIRPGRLEAPPRGPCEVVPDVVVEVLSPGDRIFDHDEKLRAYRAAEVPVVIVLNPLTRTADVRRGEEVTRLPEDGVLELPEEMPGFRLELSKVWPPAAGG